MTPPDEGINRRHFLKLGGAAVTIGATGLARDARAAETQTPEGTLYAAPPIELVRIGLVGVGLQGSSHLENFLKIPGCRVTAVCDVRQERTDWATRAITALGHPAPTAYARGARDFERLCEAEDLDLVFTATPWEWHVPVMLAAMKNGKHAATEVPAAMTLDDCWALVESAETHRRHAVMMENCNYDRAEMMVFNIVRQGVLGEIVHAEGGYLHDLRADQVREEGRRPVAARVGHETGWQSLPDARVGPGRQLPGHQPRRSLRLPGLDERAVARPAGLGARAPAERRPRAPGEVRPRRREHEPHQDRPWA